MNDTLNSHWKNDKKGFGFRMLSKMGWKDDKGLGKNETGITNNIKVTRRENGIGLGLDNDDEAVKLGSQVSSLNDVLNMLKDQYGSSSNKKKKSKSKGEKGSDSKSPTKISFGVGMK
jgi:Pin2-interacting protein X1